MIGGTHGGRHLSTDIPRPSDFSQQIDGVNDPRFSRIVQHLRPNVDLAKRVEEILKSTHIRVSDGRIDAGDLEKAASRPKVTPLDLPNVKIEVVEINGHIVYYLQPKGRVNPDTFGEQIAQPALGGVWDHFKVSGWVEQAPSPIHGISSWIFGVWVHDLTINAMNRALYIRTIPNEFSRRLGMATPA